MAEPDTLIGVGSSAHLTDHDPVGVTPTVKVLELPWRIVCGAALKVTEGIVIGTVLEVGTALPLHVGVKETVKTTEPEHPAVNTISCVFEADVIVPF